MWDLRSPGVGNDFEHIEHLCGFSCWRKLNISFKSHFLTIGLYLLIFVLFKRHYSPGFELTTWSHTSRSFNSFNYFINDNWYIVRRYCRLSYDWFVMHIRSQVIFLALVVSIYSQALVTAVFYVYVSIIRKCQTLFQKSIWPSQASLFLTLLKQRLQFLQQSKSEKYPRSVRGRDWNPQPLENESSPITTRPGLSPKLLNCLLCSPVYRCFQDREIDRTSNVFNKAIIKEFDSNWGGTIYRYYYCHNNSYYSGERPEVTVSFKCLQQRHKTLDWTTCFTRQ